MNKNKTVPGEFLLAGGLLCNSLALALFIKCDLGLSVVSATPALLARAFPALSNGMWSAIIQCLWLLAPILCFRRVKLGYLCSFALAWVFGELVDGWGYFLSMLPAAIWLRVALYPVAFFLMSFGINCMIYCKLPVLPFDTVPREFIVQKGWKVGYVRTAFDIINLTMALITSLVLFRGIVVIGVGTVVYAFSMGAMTGLLSKRFFAGLTVVPRVRYLAKIA